ncbi:MAG TPA: hypothetical protein DEQ43_00165, partial [Nocardioides bacterium]|nr:hypothetical protein [Nocardioides sp.]
RPDKPAVIGDANIALHYDPAQLNPAAFDAPTALAQLTFVADTYANSGYRRPKSDGTLGGDGRIDIYLDALPPGLYGYCTTDQGKPAEPGHFDVWSFCVLDNDYAGFTQHTPLQNLQVTAAHEYYHATQFAYDIGEDPWFLEATATWAEDELFTDVNDNAQYLRRSPITRPSRPIDMFEDGGTFHYGVWIFFRYLTERYPAKTGALPRLLLEMWQDADSSRGPRKDLYSVQAIDKALKKLGHTTLAAQFAKFSASTRFPALFREGLGRYPTKPLERRANLAAHKTKRFRAKLDHLTSATYQLVPGRATRRLQLQFEMAPAAHGSRAVVVVVGRNGKPKPFKIVEVNAKGMASRTVLFDRTVRAVEVTLVNASTELDDCYQSPPTLISCAGTAAYDNQPALLTATTR